MNQPLKNHSARKGIRPSLACTGAILLMMLASCGQTGPLFLPEDSETEAHPAEQAAEEKQKPGAEEEDEDGDGVRR